MSKESTVLEGMTEEEALAAGGPRVRFSALLSAAPVSPDPELVQQLANALHELERSGAAPVLPDGRVGGNASALLGPDASCGLLVSASGKIAGQPLTASSFCVVSSFDADAWHAEYALCTEPPAQDPRLPTSDTPLHWASLAVPPSSWKVKPRVALHGHALAEASEAEALGIPVSAKLTMCSTPDDVEAIRVLYERFPYPEHQLYVRSGHGFFLLAQSVDEALQVYRERVLPHVKTE